MQLGNTPPTAAFSLACDARVDSASEGGVESEHIGIGFARNNTGPSAQHLGGGGSEGHPSPFDPFVYDIYQGQLGLGDWSCIDNAKDEYLDFLAGSAGDTPVSDVVIETGPDYNVSLRREGSAVGSSIRDNRTISRQSKGCVFFSQRFSAGQEGDPNLACVVRSSPYFSVLPFVSTKYIVTYMPLNKAQ